VRPLASSPRVEGNNEALAMNAERGSIDRDDAEDAIARNFNRLRRCYEAAGPAMGFAAGPVKLHFEVGVDGRTLGVNVIESRLGNYDVERCLTEAATSIRFPRPHGGARATFEYSMEFRSTEERAVVDLPEDAPQAVLPGLYVRLAGDCGANVSPLEATLYVERRGQVLSVGLASKTALVPETARCTVDSLTRAPLPLMGAPAGDAVARITVAISPSNLVATASVPRAKETTKAKTTAKGKAKSQAKASKAADPTITATSATTNDRLASGLRQRRPRR
jgi:hypothetical protein